MQLRHLLEDLPVTHVSGPVDVRIGKIECDSRRVAQGDLFIAIRGGQEQDRHRFVPDALARGAGAVVVEESVDCRGATRILVENCRQALAKLAARYYNYPSRELLTVGITGTNGKTTTSFLVRQVLEAAGQPCGYLGTLGCLVENELEKLDNTTPEAAELQRLLRAMVEAGKTAAVLEVSSHGLALERVAGIQFRVAIFTNLSRDHLDFHQTEENYFSAKARLFAELDGAAGGRAIVNIDDPAAPVLLERVEAPVLTYGRRPGAQVRLAEMVPTAVGMRLRVQAPAGEMKVDTRLTGAFNCYNVMAALAAGLALEIGPEAICRGIAVVDNVPGRFEQVVAGQDFQVIVDYAHTPAGLETVLRTARELTRNRLICVFGCGGDRDRGKRPAMGRIAGELAHRVYLTSDNPRSEPPERIIEEIAAGVNPAHRPRIFPDRRWAIREALAAAGPGDVVVIAGKGHESEQILADRVVPFDDRQVARQILEELADSRQSREHGT